MPLILAIEPDPRQAALVASLSPRYLDAEVVVKPSVETALSVMTARAPDLLLTPPLLSMRDDAVLTLRVREFDERGIEVPILVIPMLAVEEIECKPAEKPAGLLTRIRKQKGMPSAPKGCALHVFADQIREYLARAAAERHDREDALVAAAWDLQGESASAPLLGELLPLHYEVHTAPPILAAEPWEQEQPVTEGDDSTEGPLPPPNVAEVETQTVTRAVETAPAIETVLAMETAPALEAAAPELPRSDQADWAALDDSGSPTEPDRELPPVAEELWTPLPVPQVQLLAPLEGQTVVRRRALKPAAVSKVSRRATVDSGRETRAPRRARVATKPIEDEWGLYDPEQCGFAALLERLDEFTDHTAATARPRKRSAIMPR